MARKPRSLVVRAGWPHHVIVRGNDGRRIFSRSGDRLHYLRALRHGLAATDCAMHAIALMSNHVHLVLTPPSTSALSECMQRTGHAYSTYRNAACGGSGKLFDERFKSIAIRDEAHLAATLPYVDLNPVRAGIVDVAAAFLWSSYRVHVGHGAAHAGIAALWTPHDWYLALGGTAARRAERYADWVATRREEQLHAVATEMRDDDRAGRRRRNGM